MGSAFHQLCPRYSGTLTPTAPTAIRLWDTFTFFTFAEEVNDQSGRTLWDNGNVFMAKASHTIIEEFGCGQHIQPRYGWAPSG